MHERSSQILDITFICKCPRHIFDELTQNGIFLLDFKEPGDYAQLNYSDNIHHQTK